MAEATVNMQAISVPVDDGEIARALTDVDAKLAVWAEAMLDAQRLLTALAARMLAPSTTATDDVPSEPEAAAPEPASTACSATEAEAPPEPEQFADQQTEADPVAETELEAPAEEPETAPPRTEQPVNRLAAPEIARSSVTPVKFTGKVDVKTKVPQPPPAPPPNEDEQLLASLDPETAKAIKVMRRLAPSKKSVKELLAEYQATKANTQTPKPEKKSWFSRGR